jgi:hypothetical protein
MGVLAEGDALRFAIAEIALERDMAVGVLANQTVRADLVALAAVRAQGLVHP